MKVHSAKITDILKCTPTSDISDMIRNTENTKSIDKT